MMVGARKKTAVHLKAYWEARGEAEAWAGIPPEILLLFNHTPLSNVSRISQNSDKNERPGIQKLEPMEDIQIQMETKENVTAN